MLQSEGHEVDVACHIVQPLRKELHTYSKCEVFDIPFNRNPLRKENLKAYKALKEVINKKNYDIVHTHTPIASAIVRLAYRKGGQTKVFYTAHGFHFHKNASLINWLLYFPMEYWLSKYTEQLITINQEDYVRAKKLFHAKKIQFVHGVGLDVEKIKNVKVDKQEKKQEFKILKDQIVLLSIGELNENKNHKFVIENLKNFKDVNFKYLICGEGILKDNLQKMIMEYNLENKVELLGYRTDIIELLNISDYFIFPSKREGLPVSVMESMACKVPVICSKIRGNSDLIQDNTNGFLFSMDDEQEFTQILTKLLLNKYDKSKLNSIKDNAVKTVENYSLPNVLNELNKIYSVK